jgi:hypothetical protein
LACHLLFIGGKSYAQVELETLRFDKLGQIENNKKKNDLPDSHNVEGFKILMTAFEQFDGSSEMKTDLLHTFK